MSEVVGPKTFFESEGIKLNKVYARLSDGLTYKTVGWVGYMKVALQPVKIVVRGYTPFGPDLSIRKIKGVSEKLIICNLNDFIKEFGPVKEEHIKDA